MTEPCGRDDGCADELTLVSRGVVNVLGNGELRDIELSLEYPGKGVARFRQFDESQIDSFQFKETFVDGSSSIVVETGQGQFGI